MYTYDVRLGKDMKPVQFARLKPHFWNHEIHRSVIADLMACWKTRPEIPSKKGYDLVDSLQIHNL